MLSYRITYRILDSLSFLCYVEMNNLKYILLHIKIIFNILLKKQLVKRLDLSIQPQYVYT